MSVGKNKNNTVRYSFKRCYELYFWHRYKYNAVYRPAPLIYDWHNALENLFGKKPTVSSPRAVLQIHVSYTRSMEPDVDRVIG